MADDAAEKRAEALLARARLYAEQAVEQVELPDGVTCRDRESLVDAMDVITGALARAFVMGYSAALDDAAPRRALVDRQRQGCKR